MPGDCFITVNSRGYSYDLREGTWVHDGGGTLPEGHTVAAEPHESGLLHEIVRLRGKLASKEGYETFMAKVVDEVAERTTELQRFYGTDLHWDELLGCAVEEIGQWRETGTSDWADSDA